MILYIYGASGAGIEIYDLAQRANNVECKYSKIVCIDDFEEEEEFYGTYRIHFSSCENYANGEEFEFIIAVGEPSARELLYNRVLEAGYKLAVLIDPSAIVSPTAKLSQGCIVQAQSIVSSNVEIGDNCMLLLSTIVGHDAVMGKHCVQCPKSTVGGKSVVGDKCFIGLASSMKQGVCLGDRVIVGMGSMMFKDVESDSTVVGNPARVTKGNDEHKVF